MKKFNKKFLLCAAVAVSVTMGATLTGCVTINEEDVKQVVSTVDISLSDDFKDEFGDYASAVTEEKILKRDLIASFLSTGYSYVQSGYSYSDVFDMLSESLVQNAVVTQYATAYMLKNKVESGERSLSEYNSKSTEKEKYEYLLDENSIACATYSLYYSLNSTLDSYEESFIEEESDEYTGSDTRTTPSDVDTQVDEYDYVAKLESYGVYTGYTGYLKEDAGEDYEPLDGTNRTTRRKAYSSFVSYLNNNYLLTDADKDTTDILALSYVQDMYVSLLKEEIVEEFNDVFEKEKEEIINEVGEDGEYTYIRNRYKKLLAEQTEEYSDTSDFETAMDSMSDTSFILYSPDTSDSEGGYTYGYVYNILLPFSTLQSAQLTNLQYYRDNNANGSDNNYFYERNQLLKEITTTDQRSAWFNGSTDYSFNAKESGIDYYGKDSGREYLFFENNVTKTGEYKSLDKYYGLYSYNGTVKKNDDGSYTLIPNKLTIDGMLNEFVAYINYVLGGTDNVQLYAGDKLGGGNTAEDFAKFYDEKMFYTDSNENGEQDSDEETDYSLLVYATGIVSTVANANESDSVMFKKTSSRYKVMAAVNELQYAYTTDTGILSNYIGYSVSAYDTSYIAEFEYAAQEAIKIGVGAFKVCAGDYGWHLIYVTDTYTVKDGAVFEPEFTKEYIETEGTFENLFYTWVKDADISDETTLKRSEIIRLYSNDDTVTTDTDVYSDLSALDNE